jgi:hypothetical protein
MVFRRRMLCRADAEAPRHNGSAPWLRQTKRGDNLSAHYFVRVMSSIFWGLVSLRRQLGNVRA